MDVFITTFDLGKQKLKVDPKISIAEFKKILQQVTSIPTQCQIIYYKNYDITSLRRTLNKLDIRPGAEFLIENSHIIRISVKTPKHEKIWLKVNNKMEIIELQKQLEMLTGIPIDVQAIYHKSIDHSLSNKNLLQLNISSNAQFILWDKQNTLQIFIKLPQEEIPMLVSPYATIMDIQDKLEGITDLPINSQLFTHNKDDMAPCSSLTMRQLRITPNERFVLYDKKEFIEIIMIAPNHRIETINVKRHSRILDLHKEMEELTGIPIAHQIISEGNINLSLSEQTFWQLNILPRTEFVLQNKCTLISIKIHFDNGDVRGYRLSQLQTIKMLIQAYLRQSTRYENTITFVCRPTADGSSPKYENAIDEEITFADLLIKNGDSLCISTVSKDRIKFGVGINYSSIY